MKDNNLYDQLYSRLLEIEKNNIEKSKANRSLLYQDYDRSTIMTNLDDESFTTSYVEENSGDGFFDNIKNLWRTINYDMDKQSISGAIEEVDEAVRDDEDIKLINKYIDLVKRRDTLQKKLETDDEILKLPQYQLLSIIHNYEDLNRQISDLDNYFMGEGRTHKVIAENMFSRKNFNPLDSKEIINRALERGWNDNNVRLGWSKYGTLGSVAGGAIEGATDIITRPLGLLGAIFGGAYNEAAGMVTDKDYELADYVKNLAKDGDGTLKRAYIGQDALKYEQYYKDLAKDYERDVNKSIENLKEQQENLKYLRFFGIDGAYDYNAVSEEWKRGREDFRNGSVFGALIHPFYTTAEVASSLDMMKYQIGAMGVDALIRRIPLAFVKRHPIVGGLLTAADVATGITAAELSRADETALEAVDAVGTRVAHDVSINGGDASYILDKIREDGKLLGIDTDSMDEADLWKLGVAINTHTNDKAFEDAKLNAQRGLNKLINANNALAVADFSESLPYMSYFGDVTKALKFPGRVVRDNLYIGEKTIGQKLNLNAIPDKKSMAFKYQEQMKASVDGVFDNYIEKAAKSLIKNNHEKIGLYGKHFAKYAKNKASKLAITGFGEMIEEGQQHLLQQRYMRGEYDDYNKDRSMFDVGELAQNTGLAATALADYFGLGFWDPDNGTDDLVKAMNAGLWGSLVQGSGFNALSNITNPNESNIRGLIRQLRADKTAARIFAELLKTLQDHVHIDMFYDRFMKGADWNNMYEALSSLAKAVDPEEVITYTDKATGEQKLILAKYAKNVLDDEEFLKTTGYTKDEWDLVSNTVKSLFIEDDIKLMTSVWSLFSDDEITKAWKKRGVSRKDEQYRQFLKDGATQIAQYYKNGELVANQQGTLDRMQVLHLVLANKLFSEETSLEEKKQILKDFPLLANVLEKLNKRYRLYIKEINSDSPSMMDEEEFKKWADAITDGQLLYDLVGKKAIEQIGIDEDILHTYRKKKRGGKHKGESRKKVSAARLMADRIVNSENKYELLRKAFPSKIKEFTDKIDTEEKFTKNKFVQDYVYDNHPHIKPERGDLIEIYRNKDKDSDSRALYEEILEGAARYSGKPISKKDFIRRNIQRLHQYHKMQALAYNLEWTQDQASALEKVRYLTGLDIDPTELQGWIKTYKDELDRLKKLEKQLLGENLKYEELFGDLKFDDTDLFKKTYADFALNVAIQKSLRKVRDAYLTIQANPESIRLAIYGENPDETIFDEYVNEYKKIIDEYNSTSQLERDVRGNAESAVAADLKSISENAAWALIDDRIRKRMERRKIVHRKIEQGEQRSDETPALSVPVVEEDEQLPVEDDGTVDIDGDIEESKAERELKASFYHEHRKKKTQLLLLDDRRKAKAEQGSESKKQEEDDKQKLNGGDLNKSNKENVAKTDVDSDQTTQSEDKTAHDPITPNGEPEDALNDQQDDKPLNEDDSSSFIPIDSDVNSSELENALLNEDDAASFIPVDSNDEEVTDNVQQGMEDSYIPEDPLYDPEDVLPTTGLHEDETTGFLDYNGTRLNEEEEKNTRRELELLAESDEHPIPIDEIIDYNDNDENIEDVVGDVPINLVWQTCFYKYDEQDTPIKLTVNGKEINQFNGKPLRPGGHLAKKLLIPGWLSSCKKYYVVTLAEVSKNLDKNDTDAFTVALIIEDEENSYAAVYRSLGDIVSLSNQLDRNGSNKQYHIHRREILKNWLLLKNMNIKRLLDYADLKISYPVKQKDESDEAYGARVAFYQKQVADAYKYAINQYARTLFAQQYAQLHRDDKRAILKAEKQWDTLERKHNETDSQFEDRKRQWKEDHVHFTNLARIYFSKPNLYIFSDLQIESELNRLKLNRDDIINAYLTKNGKDYVFPDQPRINEVIPENVSLNNGKIDNVKTPSGAPIYRTIVDQDTPIDEIQKMIDDDSLLIGIGKGERAELGGLKTIVSFGHILQEEERVLFKKGGLSGKLYWMVSSLVGKGTVPVMLSEEKFNILHRDSDDGGLEVVTGGKIKLLISKEGGKITVKDDKYKPSAAEVLLYMILGENILPGFDDIRSLVPLFINEDPNTLLDKQPETKDGLLNNLAAKQLYYGPSVGLEEVETDVGKKILKRVTTDNTVMLNIGIKLSDGTYKLQRYTKDEILNNDATRQLVVLAIADQMHWNTDAATFKDSASVSISSSILGKLITYLINRDAESGRFDNMSEEEYLNSTVSILGCPQLSFRIGDFFYKTEDSTQNDLASLRPINGSVMAWMIKSGHIKTDVSKQIFKAPFVFANGVKQPDKAAAQEVSSETNAPVEPADVVIKEKEEIREDEQKAEGLEDLEENPFYDEEKQKRVIKSLPDRIEYAGGIQFPKTLKEVVEKIKKWTSFLLSSNDLKYKKLANKIDLEKNDVILMIILEDRDAEKISEYSSDGGKEIPVSVEDDDALDEVDSRMRVEIVDNLLKKFNKAYNTSIKQEDVEYSTISYSGRQNQVDLAEVAFFCKDKETGKIKVIVTNIKASAILESGRPKNDSHFFALAATGVFSKKKNAGKFNESEARKWLSDILGIDLANVIVFDGLKNAVDNLEVFGVTSVATDTITNELFGYIGLSRRGGATTHYHEAWHYVNLLIHNDYLRQVLYKAYLNSHPWLKLNKKLKWGDVEEMLAEDFRRWVLLEEDRSIKGSIFRAFNNILDIILIFSNRSAYKNVFKAIKNGDYKGTPLNKESLNEFKNAYKDGAFSIGYYTPGLDKKEDDGYKFIYNHQLWFDARDALARHFINSRKLETERDLLKLSGSLVEDIYKYLSEWIDESEEILEEDKDVLKEVLKNPETVKKAITEYFEELGITVKIRKIKDLKKAKRLIENPEEAESTEKEDKPDNTWDVFDLSISKRDNASIRTKLFMKQIPVLKRMFAEDGSVIYRLDKDIYGNEKMWSFKDSWNLILDKLWLCESIDDVDEKGEYKQTSMMGMIENLAKSNVFFKALQSKLSRIDSSKFLNTILKSQLFATINSNKPQVSFLEIKDDDILLKKGDTFDSLSDLGEDDYGAITNTSIADRLRNWIIRNDNLLQANKNLLRQWSTNILGQGLVSIAKNGKTIISKDYATRLDSKMKNVLKLLEKYKTDVTDSKDLLRAIESEIIPKIVELYQEVGIAVDEDVILQQIKMSSSDKEITPELQLDVLYDSFLSNETYKDEKGRTRTKKAKQDTVPRMILAIIDEGLKDELDKNDYIKYAGNRKKQSLDKLFDGFDESSGVYKLANASNTIHPSSRQFSIKDPKGNTLYPLNSNSFVSDRIRQISIDKNFAKRMKKSKYCEYSMLLNISEDSADVIDTNSHFKLNAFVGIKDGNKNIGGDYFDITPMEDYIAKLTMIEGVYKDGKVSGGDMLILPTMADKKTWYSISHKNLKLFHDAMLFLPYKDVLYPIIYDKYNQDHPKPENSDELVDWQYQARKWYKNLDSTNELKKEIDESARNKYQDNSRGVLLQKFSDTTLTHLGKYMLSELNSVIEYYKPEKIKKLVLNKNLRITNYHGNVENGRMDFSGNGGQFRYFYDAIVYKDKDGKQYNLNQRLQMLYELQKKIESGEITIKDPKDPMYKYVSALPLGNKDKSNLDGFELVRMELNSIKNEYFKNGFISRVIKENINSIFILRTIEELDFLSEQNSPVKLVEKVDGVYKPVGIPVHLLNKYADKISTVINKETIKDAYTDLEYSSILSDALFSLIANYVVNSATSVIEFEKVFSGDPAFYSRKKAKDQPKTQLNLDVKSSGNISNVNIEVDNVYDTFSDKIKRLGSTLSPGDEIRLHYSNEELQKAGRRILSVENFTNMHVEDVEMLSVFIDITQQKFKKQLLIDTLRLLEKDSFSKMCNEEGLSFELGIEKIYKDDSWFNKIYTKYDKYKDNIEQSLKTQTNPYNGVNVCDAQVFLRPEMYRRIRIGLGQWSRDDENAYLILEGKSSEYKNGEWMNDPKLYKAVRDLQIQPLKLAYFQNDPVSENGEYFEYIKPILGKQAAFPLFRFLAGNGIGAEIYERMNRKGNELDMISFKSAVKVGAVLDGVKMKKDGATGELQLSSIDDEFFLNSSLYIDYDDNPNNSTYGKVKPNHGKTAPVEILKMKYLRFLLNTEAHEAESRNLGTLMFKIAFSSIIDDAIYGADENGNGGKSGAQIKSEIMDIVNTMTDMGVSSVVDEFFDRHEDGSISVNDEKVQSYVQRIVENNNLGSSAEMIVSTNTAASLAKREVFENSATAIVESDVVDILTFGGSAVQQSSFGFIGFGNKNVTEQIGVFRIHFNQGKLLKWHRNDNSMEVMLSMNFFRHVLPKDLKDATFEEQRLWLIENDIILGVKKDGTESNPKPFGAGYRIPTQGLSSIFSFVVADVLPPMVGDLIIVPPEFTAQTGSDFDVDKIYLALKSYVDGKYETYDPEHPTKTALANRLLETYISLLCDDKNYSEARASIDTFTKMLKKELIDAKGVLRDPLDRYLLTGYELTPSFLIRRKMEFSVGKAGIAPFALNVTNLALTQLTHFTMHYSGKIKEYGFGNLDEIYGNDGLRISGWLSAMVNAHVDVAKDPYIFDLNVNKATYNYANFLIRAGMGLSTFTFLSLQSLKNISAKVVNSGGLYGSNLLGETPTEEIFKISRAVAIKEEYTSLKSKLESLLEDHKNSKTKSLSTSDVVRLNKLIDYLDYQILPSYKKKDVKSVPNLEFDRKKVFDKDYAISMIKNKRSNDIKKLLDYYEFQTACVRAFSELEDYAQGISSLVSVSQIDTKKFGNTIRQHINFENKIEHFKRDSYLWTINKPGFEDQFKDKKGKVDRKKACEAAIDIYFKTTYLEHKFTKTVDLVRDILKTQLVTATTVYRKTLKRILCRINGGIGEFYNEEYNEDKLDSISKAIDNIFRFNILFNVGKNIDLTGDAIDFTMGGNKKAVIEKMRQLLYGTDKIDPLYKRLYNLKKDLLSKKIALKKYSDIVDENGDVHNELLDNLIPLSPTEKVSIGRIILVNSSMDTDTNAKNRLVASFALLLSSENKEVSQLARDLAFYTYYSLYDQDAKDSFFDLIPPEYRSQYDIALRNTLKALAYNSEDAAEYTKNMLGISDYVDNDNADDNNMSIVSIMDSMCRNYWYDDGIVPRYFPKKQREDLNKSDVIIYGSEQFLGDVDGFPKFVAMSRGLYDKDKIKNNPYFKIQKNGLSLLYRQVGRITRTFLYGLSAGNKLSTDIIIYAPIPKAGYHKGNIHHYELYADYNTATIFDDNKISPSFSLQDIRENVQKIIDEYNNQEANEKDKNGRKFEADIEWDNEEIPDLYDQLNLDTYKSYVNSEDVNVNNMKIVQIESRGKRGVNSWMKTASVAHEYGCIIQLCTQDEGDSVVPDQYKDKVIRININKPLSDEQYKQIKEYLSGTVKRIFITSDKKINADISKNDVDNFLKSLGNISEKDKQYYRDNINVFYYKIRQHKINLAVSKIMLKLLNDGIDDVHIQSLFESVNDTKSNITTKALVFNSQQFKKNRFRWSVAVDVVNYRGKEGFAKKLYKMLKTNNTEDVVDENLEQVSELFTQLIMSYDNSKKVNDIVEKNKPKKETPKEAPKNVESVIVNNVKEDNKDTAENTKCSTGFSISDEL